MKVAFWGIGIIILGVLGAVLINLFGNIAVTNQLNYTTMKNAVEAAMYDAIDEKYMSGFCLCTDKEKVNGKYSFTSRKDYDLVDVTYDNDEMICESKRKNCSILQGERRIDKQVFAESFVRRFAEMVNNNKDYRIIFQEIIEYPPKVSVSVNSKDKEYLPTDAQEGYTIVNQMDSIIETWGDVQISEVTKQPVATVKPTATPLPNATSAPKKYCYRKVSISGDPDKDSYKWMTAADAKKKNEGIPTGGYTWKKIDKVKKEADCHCEPNGWKLIKKYGGTFQFCTNKGGTQVEKNCDKKSPPFGTLCSGSIVQAKNGQWECGQFKYTCTKPTVGSGTCDWDFTGSAKCGSKKIEAKGSNVATCAGALEWCKSSLKEQCNVGLKEVECKAFREREWQLKGKNPQTGYDTCTIESPSETYACQGKKNVLYCKCL